MKRWPWLRHVFADGGCTSREALKRVGPFALEIVKRPGDEKGFEVSRQWIVERTFAGLGR
ncbi:hypothetical protein NKI19_32410 [Mesorhizobium sp. M0751]|uniref:hypothetical protein n=1 Tax=unclassified Mesorhizobium TaxID=325217 RepID=UPI00333D704E